LGIETRSQLASARRGSKKTHLSFVALGYDAALFAIFAGNATSDDTPDHNIE